MMLTTPQSEAFAAAFDEAEAGNSDTDAMFAEGETVEVDVVATGVDSQPPELTGQPPELTEDDLEDRLYWDRCKVIGQIADCSRIIEEVEDEIEGYQIAIKEAKEILKGQQAQLARYSSQLRQIVDGHPLPKNPNAPADAPGASDKAPGATAESPATADWRSVATRDLLEGLKGCGPKKVDAICEIAPTVGALEDLRGQASSAFEPFKSMLPKGCGEELAQAIEDKMLALMQKMPVDDGADSDDEPASDDGVSEE
jgi:hypothetical protein